MQVNLKDAMSFMALYGGSNYRLDRNETKEEYYYSRNKSMDVNEDGSITLLEYIEAKFKAANPKGTFPPADAADAAALELAQNIDTLANSDNPASRISAVEVLTRGPKETVLPPLIKALNDPKIMVRMAAAYALGELGDKRAVKTLLAHLADPDENVRCAVISALGDIGDQSVTDKLIARLTSEFSMEAKKQLIFTLGQLKAVKATRILEKLLSSPFPPIGRAAALALIMIDPGKYGKLFKRCLINSESASNTCSMPVPPTVAAKPAKEDDPYATPTTPTEEENPENPYQ